MTTGQTSSLTIAKTILESVVDEGRVVAQVTGDSRVDDQGKWVLELDLMESSGNRGADLLEGDEFEFAGATWKVAKVYEPTTATRGAVAELVRVSEFEG